MDCSSGSSAGLCFFVALLTDPVGFYTSHTLLIANIGINSILAASMFVVLYSGQLSLASPGFMAIGAYTSVLMELNWHTSLALNVAAGSALAGVVGVLVGLPVLRLKGVFLAIATIGFIEALRLGVILNLPITGEGLGLKHKADPLGGINMVLIAVAAVVFLLWRLTKGRLGHAWTAIRQDELAALSQGIDVARYKLLAFTLSAVLAGFAGGLEAHLQFFVDPGDAQYGVTRAVQALTFAVLGGSGSIFGPVVGALFLTTLPEIIRQAADYRDVVSGVILIAVIVFRPQGIVGRGGLAIVRPRWWPRAQARAPSTG
jgi:branched-chain amino acid transport system permease protein